MDRKTGLKSNPLEPDEDILARLVREGSNAFHQHYSLGMWKLCYDAAEEISRLRARLKNHQEG